MSTATKTIEVGSLVRSYDFSGRTDCYIEGLVERINKFGSARALRVGHPSYEIRVEKRVIENQEHAGDRLIGALVFPPLNGTADIFGNQTSGVELITPDQPKKQPLHFHRKQQYKEKHIMALMRAGLTFAEAAAQWNKVSRLTMAELDILCFPSYTPKPGANLKVNTEVEISNETRGLLEVLSAAHSGYSIEKILDACLSRVVSQKIRVQLVYNTRKNPF